MLTNIQLLCSSQLFQCFLLLNLPVSRRSKGKRDEGQKRSENINLAVESPPPSYRPQVLHLRMQMFPVEPSIICGNSWRKWHPRSLLLSFDKLKGQKWTRRRGTSTVLARTCFVAYALIWNGIMLKKNKKTPRIIDSMDLLNNAKPIPQTFVVMI